MKNTSQLGVARTKIEDRLTEIRARYEESSGDTANVLGGKVLGLEEALRIIDNSRVVA